MEWEKVRRQLLLGTYMANQMIGLMFTIMLLIFFGWSVVPLVIATLIVYIGSQTYMKEYLKQNEV